MLPARNEDAPEEAWTTQYVQESEELLMQYACGIRQNLCSGLLFPDLSLLLLMIPVRN